MDEEPAHVHYRCHYICRTGHTGMEERTDLLQYDLPGGNDFGIFLPFFFVTSGTGCREMQELQSMLTPLQGRLHRL